MEKVEIKKNLLDLQHQKLLNYLNIIIILLISSFITVVIGTKESWSGKVLIPLSLVLIVVISIIVLFFENKLRKVKNEIEKIN